MNPEDVPYWTEEDQEREDARLRALGIIENEEETEDDD